MKRVALLPPGPPIHLPKLCHLGARPVQRTAGYVARGADRARQRAERQQDDESCCRSGAGVWSTCRPEVRTRRFSQRCAGVRLSIHDTPRSRAGSCPFCRRTTHRPAGTFADNTAGTVRPYVFPQKNVLGWWRGVGGEAESPFDEKGFRHPPLSTPQNERLSGTLPGPCVRMVFWGGGIIIPAIAKGAGLC